MTNVGILKECPNCSQQVLQEKQKYCTNCGFDLNFRKTSEFGTPDYYYFQIQESVRSHSGTKATPDMKLVKQGEIINRYQIHLEHSTGEECLASLSDALDLIATVPKRKHTIDELKGISTFGKRIGLIATSLENLYKSVGVFNAESQGRSEFTEEL